MIMDNSIDNYPAQLRRLMQQRVDDLGSTGGQSLDDIRRRGISSRRRRAATTGLVVAAIVGTTGFGAAQMWADESSGPAREIPVASTPAIPPAGEGTSEQEWRADIVETFNSLLPADLTPVRDVGDAAQRFEVGTPSRNPAWFHVRLDQWPSNMEHIDCAAVDTAQSCEQRELPQGDAIVAYQQRTDDSTNTASILYYAGERLMTVHFFGEKRLPLSTRELLRMSTTNDFTAFVERGMARSSISAPEVQEPTATSDPTATETPTSGVDDGGKS